MSDITNRIRQYEPREWNTITQGSETGLMGKTTTKPRPITEVEDLPLLALKFKRLLKHRGWTPSRLHAEAVKRFGKDAAVAQSFRRLIRADAPESDSKTVIQAEAILSEPIADDGQSAELTASVIAPLVGHIPAARDATEEQIVAESRKLMNSRHASLHALLTLLLANK